MSTQELATDSRPCAYHFALDGRQVLGFDTGLDSRAFARARLAHLLAEPAHIVFTDGKCKSWKTEGVVEACNSAGGADGTSNDATPTMHFWGAPFKGDRLDHILNSGDRDKALATVLVWLKAHLALNSAEAPLWPFAAFIAIGVQNDSANASEGASDASGAVSNEVYPSETVFFPQKDIIRCCMQKLEPQAWIASQRYINPALKGVKAINFTAAAMLYQIFVGEAPFTAADEQMLHEDMKDSNFLPIAYAAPGLDETIATFIQEGLTATEETPESTVPALTLLRRFKNAGAELQIASFFRELATEEKTALLEEKNKYQKKQNISLKTMRFITYNKAKIIGVTIGVFVLAFFLASIISAQLRKPTTQGMDSLAVVKAYYAAINEMNSQMMEACVYRNAGKNDVGMVSNFFVVTKMRQGYEHSLEQFIPAQYWLDNGQEPQRLLVFGITDLQIIANDEATLATTADAEIASYSATFILWVPLMASDTNTEANAFEGAINNQTQGIPYTDELKLQKIKGNWRIVEIMRDGKKR